ncbi:MAG: rod-binding protein [Phenylobacterium sp.]|jgi:flagellar protein FlgJ|uniref:rod-binding protein n=1 Tax=unclassified Phenylobacterium TaxID=2640670 RepID=UPI0008C60B91|nr:MULTISPECIES: rod-binding protein [unclassified Phenylobacterium]MBJ7409662.1 rod-binding protein [Phenylobacterium sp.]OHB27823.1 MAG: chemotaxis protein chel [Phenylobacterium sp. RIFCSPHIGHO2_01_FULL_69_31]
MAGPISPPTISPNLLTPTVQATTADLAKSKARDAGQKFEAQFLSTMFQHMFQGLETDGPFGGGAGEEMFRSMMTEAMGKQVAKSGGIGLADTVQREILKLQGLQ